MAQFTEENILNIKSLVKDMMTAHKKAEAARLDLQEKTKKVSAAIGDGANHDFARTVTEAKAVLGQYYLEQSDA